MNQNDVDSNAARLDLIVVGFTGELRALKLQARSLRLYAAANLFGTLYYVCNDNAFRHFETYIETQVKPELGALASSVCVVDYQKLLGKRIKITGWRSQQVLKLLMSRKVATKQYLILDSKNHFIRPFSASTFLSENGLLRAHSVPINPLFRRHFNAACTYFGVKEADDIKEALPTTTPFLMATKITCDLLDDVERRESKPFFDFFIENGSFNEFYFYVAYMLSKKNLMSQTYQESKKYALALFGGDANKPKRIEALMLALENTDICCTGIHRRIFEAGLLENLTVITAMWHRFGLVENSGEAAYFQAFEKPVRRKRFILF